MAKAVQLVDKGTSTVKRIYVFTQIFKKTNHPECSYKSDQEVHRVFSEAEEVMLTEYIKTYSQMTCGLTIKMVRQLTCELGAANAKQNLPTS